MRPLLVAALLAVGCHDFEQLSHDYAQISPDAGAGSDALLTTDASPSDASAADTLQTDAQAACDPIANMGCPSGNTCYFDWMIDSPTCVAGAPGTQAVNQPCFGGPAQCEPHLLCDSGQTCRHICHLGGSDCLAYPGTVCRPIYFTGGQTTVYGACL